jgi:hypothetical protein
LLFETGLTPKPLKNGIASPFPLKELSTQLLNSLPVLLNFVKKVKHLYLKQWFPTTSKRK